MLYLTVRWLLVASLALLAGEGPPLSAYSVQTHEQLIDLSWKGTIRPFILRHFPHATEAELEGAHAYAYGGCAIQDLGYYPFGHTFFSDLTHYVRTADFVQSLFDGAKNPNELAFAVGALSHYVGDTIGHSRAVNLSVPVEFPELEKKYGESVAYDQDPRAHVRTEFAFDVNEITKHRMAPAAYLRHVGLKVPSALLANAFLDTYGLEFRRVLGRRRPDVRSYRFAVRSFLPRIAYAEAVLHRKGFPPDQPSKAFEVFERNLADADFKAGWDPYRKKAGIGTHLVAYAIFILPKIGPLSVLAIRGPNGETHERYVESVNAATDRLRLLLSGWEESSRLFPNLDLDTGEKVEAGNYWLTDETYAKLLAMITRDPRSKLPAGIKEDVLRFYADPQAPISTKEDRVKWARVERQLAVLRGMSVTSDRVKS